MGWRSGDWLGHSRTLMCFFLSHSFVALAVCFGSLSCWNIHLQPIFNALAGFNALDLMVHGPVHRPFYAVQLSCPHSRKTPPKHNVSTSMFDGGDGVLGVIGSIPPPPNTASWVDAKELDFGLIWPQHFHPVVLWIISKLQTGCTCTFLSRGTLRAQQDFSPSRRSVTNCFLGDYGPSCLEIIDKILPCSSGLIPHRSHDHWNSTRWDLAWSPRPREIDSYFVFLPFVNNRTNCCHLLTKLLDDSLVAIPALCRSTILSLTSLDSSLVLAMVESLESDRLIASVDRYLLYS